MEYFLLSLIALTLGFLIIPFVGVRLKGVISAVSSSFAFVLSLPAIIPILVNGKTIATNLNFNYPIGSVSVVIDPLSAFFILLFSLSGALTTIYSIEYMNHYHDNSNRLSSFYIFLHLLIITMMVLVTVQNALMFLIVWELMSLSSFFLVTFENEKEDVRKAGIYYMIAMQVGAAFLIVAFAWVSFEAGSLNFSEFAKVFNSNVSLATLSFLLFFVGFGMKAGFYPFHTWLPKAHPAAPSPVSAMMSGVMIKTGIYGILRILLIIKEPPVELGIIVFIISLISGVLGVMNAIMQHDIKKLLAYHSIENIGIIGLGIGVGMLGLSYHNMTIAVLGFAGGLLHIFNHFTFKSLLFFGAGAIYSKLHTRNIESLGGLVKSMPKVSVMFLIGSIAITGLPPLSGFISEFAIYFGLGKGLLTSNLWLQVFAIIGISGLAFIGVMAVLCFTKVFGISFLGTPRFYLNEVETEPSKFMLAPMAILSILIILVGFIPILILPILNNIVNLFVGETSSQLMLSISDTFEFVSQSILLFTLIIGALFLIRYFLIRKRSVTIDKTWGCGYQLGNNRAQYSASSFASPFYMLIKEIVHLKENIIIPKGCTPKEAKYSSHSDDQIEFRLIRPILRAINKIPDYFMWIQTGNTQNYILYGVIFLILILIWIFGVA